MSTTADEIAVDIDAADAAAAKKAAKKPPATVEGEVVEPAVVVDSELAAKTANKEIVTPEAGVEKLQKQLKEEREARLAAENRANEAARAEAEARGTVQATQLDQIKGAIAQLTQANDVLEVQYAEALAAQDFKAAAKVQRGMSDNAAKLTQLEAGKIALEKAPKPQPRAPADPVERLAVTLTPPSAAWVRAHPEFVRDPLKNKQMIAAHELAIARGYEADSPQYFSDIEGTLRVGASTQLPAHVDDGHAGADEPTAAAAQASTGGRQAAPPAAPVSRSGNGAAGRPNTVKLSPEECEIARASFPDSKTPLEDYARQKLALKKEGRMS
jgi:hypothetical protein